MKRIISLLLALGITSSLSTAYAQEYVYTSSGINRAYYDDDVNNYELSMICIPGAVVRCQENLFDKRLFLHSEPFGDYSVFVNTNNSQTLTLGLIKVDEQERNLRKRIQMCVYNQIEYIQSIGGIMTGYELVNIEGKNDIALNISWDVNGEHHFARFGNNISCEGAVGYYDYMFYESNEQTNANIEYMNETFYVAYEFQHVYWKPYDVYGE